MRKAYRLKSRVLILIGTILFCIIAFEFLIRLNLFSPPYINSNGYWIEQFKIHFPYDKNNYLPGNMNPDLGYTIKPNLDNYKFIHGDTEINITTSYISTDSQGFRGTQNYTIQKGNKTRIWVLGDSFTFGYCVNNSQAFPYYLQNMYNNSEVINTGTPGWGFDQQLLELEQVGLKYKPEVILVGFFPDDINRDGLSFRGWYKPRFILENGGLKLTDIPLPKKSFITSPFYPRTLDYIYMLKDWMFSKARQAETYEITYKIFQRMKADAESINSTLILVYLPYSPNAVNNQTPNPLYTYICDNLNISCINTIQNMNDFLQNKSNKYGYFSCHYSPQIQYIVANTTYNYIKNYSLPQLNKIQINNLPNKSYTWKDVENEMKRYNSELKGKTKTNYYWIGPIGMVIKRI